MINMENFLGDPALCGVILEKWEAYTESKVTVQ